MIVREAFYGATRFSEFQRNTGIAKNLLSDRLSMLVEEDILQIENIGERGTRYAYRFTDKGRALVPVFVAIIQWTNAHVYGDDQRPIDLIERASGQLLEKLIPTSEDGTELKWDDIVAAPGPGANKAARQRILQSPHGIGAE